MIWCINLYSYEFSEHFVKKTFHFVLNCCIDNNVQFLAHSVHEESCYILYFCCILATIVLVVFSVFCATTEQCTDLVTKQNKTIYVSSGRLGDKDWFYF